MVDAAFSKAGKGGSERDRGRSPSQKPQRSRTSSQGLRGTNRPQTDIPSSKVAGCWSCGNQGHCRQKCPTFHAIKDASNGKVHKDYEGASEKSMKSTAKFSVAIKAMTSRPAETTQRGQDLTSAKISSPKLVETYLWSMLSGPAPPRAPVSPPTANRNQYDDLTEFDDDEKSEVAQALAQLT